MPGVGGGISVAPVGAVWSVFLRHELGGRGVPGRTWQLLELLQYDLCSADDVATSVPVPDRRFTEEGERRRKQKKEEGEKGKKGNLNWA